jgi:hypothetical protein
VRHTPNLGFDGGTGLLPMVLGGLFLYNFLIMVLIHKRSGEISQRMKMRLENIID